MLHNLSWLKQGELFPPSCEKNRIQRYLQNRDLFDGEHFATDGDGIYATCARRIKRVIGNFEDVISFPVLLNYQRMMSLKMADLVCGEYPTITGKDKEDNDEIKDVRDYTDFDSKLYSTVIDISRYGDAIQRLYLDENGKKTFTNWDPTEWYPIVSQDGTNRILQHVLCWKENKSKIKMSPDWYLHVQIHEKGFYDYRVFKMDSLGGTIGEQVASTRVSTGLDINAVQHLKSFGVTDTVYGYDDYMQIDSILSEIMTRVGQISVILDKHADPNITGPASMLSVNKNTGEYELRTGKFFAVSPGEDQPQYMVWDGQLESSFKQLEFLINQLYILSEMGAALLGDVGKGSQAVSGTAMRFKMVNPLSKARRVSNALTKPVRNLFANLSEKLELNNIAVFWADGLPDDPRENIELVKLATGAKAMMPLENAIVEYFKRSNEEALDWIKKLEEQDAKEQAATNKPGPQDGTGINPQAKGSKTGLNSFKGLNNK